MPNFQFSGRGKSTGRKRKRVVKAIDLATAMELMDNEGTVVDECVQLPYPPATPALVAQVIKLGAGLSNEPSKPECVFEVLRWCMLNHRAASIVYLTDVDGSPWHATIEPHGFRRSKEGLRLRCYLPPQEHEPEVVFEFQTTGWHLYLIEDVERAAATQTSFEPRPYARDSDVPFAQISFS